MSAGTERGVTTAIVEVASAIEDRLSTVLLGKPHQVRLAAAALLSGQHLLVNDLPGMGKTTLGSALARVIDGAFGRVQGTPDLLPTDLTGFTLFSPEAGRWTYRPGPLQSNVVLVDEVNRISPRTQSALLEAMAEGQLTIDGVSRPVPRPFLVVATMNPAGSAGTFPLAASQLDRFGLALSLGAADRDTQRRVLRGTGGHHALADLRPVIPADVLPDLQAQVAATHLADSVLDYVLDVCHAVSALGHLSTRAPQSLVALGRALAVLDGRDFVVPDDIKELAVPCLCHRLAPEGAPVDGGAGDVAMAAAAVAAPVPGPGWN